MSEIPGLPTDIWEKANAVVEAIDGEMWMHDTEGRQISWGSARMAVGRAILAAEQRGAERERERCARYIEQRPGSIPERQEIAAAIRKGD